MNKKFVYQVGNNKKVILFPDLKERMYWIQLARERVSVKAGNLLTV